MSHTHFQIPEWVALWAAEISVGKLRSLAFEDWRTREVGIGRLKIGGLGVLEKIGSWETRSEIRGLGVKDIQMAP